MARKTPLKRRTAEKVPVLSADVSQQTDAERVEEVLNAYRRALGGFSDEEMNILDGIILA